MSKSDLPVPRILGIALLVIGAGLLWWGYQLSDSIGSQLTETISGSMPDGPRAVGRSAGRRRLATGAPAGLGQVPTRCRPPVRRAGPHG